MSDVREELSRDLSLFDVTMIGVGAMIGAGIFVLTGIAAGAAGPALILAFALNGLVALLTAMAYAELGSAIPEAGGGYVWVKYGLPGPSAYIVGWMNWFAQAVAGSLYGLGFSSYLLLAAEELLGLHLSAGLMPLAHKGLAAAIIGFFIWVNFRGASETGKIGNVVTVAKVLILGLFIASGVWAILHHPEDLRKFHDFAPYGWTGIVSAMGLIFIAFEGYDIIVQAGEEVKRPRANIPKAVFISLALVIPIYMLVAFVTIGAVNPGADVPTYQWLAEHAELGVAEAARQFMPLGMVLLLIGGLLSTMSALNAATYSATRVSFAMGRDKYLPDGVADVHPQTRTPFKALILSGLLVLGMAIAVPLDAVAAASAIMFLLLFLMVNIAILRIRKQFGDQLDYGYRVPFFPVVPVLAIVTQLGIAVLMFQYSPLAWYVALGWIGLGFLGYYAYGWRRVDEETKTPVMGVSRHTTEPTEGRYHVLVPIANPATMPQLVAPAIEAARRNDGVVTLLHVVTVPASLPLAAGRRFIERSRPLIDEARALAERTDVPIEIVTRLSHRPSQAILDTAVEKETRLLVMGWRGHSRASHTLIGKNIDWIVERVNCDLLVVQQTEESSPNSILLPIETVSEVRPALSMVRLLSARSDLKLTILHVFPSGTSEADQEAFVARINRRVERFREAESAFEGDVKVLTRVARDPVASIIELANEHETIVLGTPRRNWFRRRFLTSTPARIAQRVDQPVILVRPHGSVLGFGLHRLVGLVSGDGDDSGSDDVERRLDEKGLLKERAPRSDVPTRGSAQRVTLMALAALGVGTAAIMYVGYGQDWTWVGAVGFVLTLWLFTWRSVRTINQGAGS